MDYAEDAVFENRQGGATEGSVVAGTHHGREAIGQWLANWFSTFGSYRFEIEESIENGDRVYLALCSIARGEISGAEVTMPTHHAFTVRDSLIARHVFSGEPEGMRREAGIAV
jgi:ketosteroid isomerase-like protein